MTLTPMAYWKTFKKRERFADTPSFQKFVRLMETHPAYLKWVIWLLSDYGNYVRTYALDYSGSREIRQGMETHAPLR